MCHDTPSLFRSFRSYSARHVFYGSSNELLRFTPLHSARSSHSAYSFRSLVPQTLVPHSMFRATIFSDLWLTIILLSSTFLWLTIALLFLLFYVPSALVITFLYLLIIFRYVRTPVYKPACHKASGQFVIEVKSYPAPSAILSASYSPHPLYLKSSEIKGHPILEATAQHQS
jgi:hypothetical protein